MQAGEEGERPSNEYSIKKKKKSTNDMTSSSQLPKWPALRSSLFGKALDLLNTFIMLPKAHRIIRILLIDFFLDEDVGAAQIHRRPSQKFLLHLSLLPFPLLDLVAALVEDFLDNVTNDGANDQKSMRGDEGNQDSLQ